MTHHDELIARNVRRLRSERQLTMGELARRSGLSKQTLSKVEQAIGNPTIGTLNAIALALGTSARALITEWGTGIRVQSAEAAEWSPGPVGELRFLDQIYGSGYVRSYLLKLYKTARKTSGDVLSRGSLHHVYLLEGEAEVGPSGQMVVLRSGDFVRFPADGGHEFRALSDTARLHIVTTFPQVPQLGPVRQE
ncbi:helix-turn-helix domain-containing protein [soil metagenome]